MLCRDAVIHETTVVPRNDDGNQSSCLECLYCALDASLPALPRPSTDRCVPLHLSQYTIRTTGSSHMFFVLSARTHCGNYQFLVLVSVLVAIMTAGSCAAGVISPAFARELVK